VIAVFLLLFSYFLLHTHTHTHIHTYTHTHIQVSGYLMCVVIAVFFYLGPSVVYYMPRVMPGCLLIHIGIDLTRYVIRTCVLNPTSL
jgi:MFS superfamily sulfate permease-like transporter